MEITEGLDEILDIDVNPHSLISNVVAPNPVEPEEYIPDEETVEKYETLNAFISVIRNRDHQRKYLYLLSKWCINAIVESFEPTPANSPYQGFVSLTWKETPVSALNRLLKYHISRFPARDSPPWKLIDELPLHLLVVNLLLDSECYSRFLGDREYLARQQHPKNLDQGAQPEFVSEALRNQIDKIRNDNDKTTKEITERFIATIMNADNIYWEYLTDDYPELKDISMDREDFHFSLVKWVEYFRYNNIICPPLCKFMPQLDGRGLYAVILYSKKNNTYLKSMSDCYFSEAESTEEYDEDKNIWGKRERLGVVEDICST